jgi:hypothetical protein
MNPTPAFLAFAVSLIGAAACIMLIIVRSLMERREASEGRPALGQPVDSSTGRWFLLVFLFGLLVAGYYVLRFHGLWLESDTARITLTIKSIHEGGVLVPERFFYQHGFGYQLVSNALMFTTGLSVYTLQTILYPFLGIAGINLLSIVFFRQVLHDPRAAALASVLYIFDPFVLFVVLRGSHEKITWLLMMMALVFLYRSIGQPIRRMTIYVCLFYIVVFAIDTTNVFFGSVFLVAVIFSMTLGFLLSRFWRNDRPPLPRKDIQRLMYISLSGTILVFIFIAYIYPPALGNLRVLRGVLEQLSALLLSFEIKTLPYEYISYGWINTQTYVLLSAWTWIVIFISLPIWLHQGIRILRGKTAPGMAENLSWMMYTGFAIQIAVSIVVDLSGALSGNMQLRIFPCFTIMAIVLIIRFLMSNMPSLQANPGLRRLILAMCGILSVWFTMASALKATNDPFLSNKWSVYTPKEVAGVRWMDAHLERAKIWSGVDERLYMLFIDFLQLESQKENSFQFGKFKSDVQFFLSTDLDHLRSARLGMNVPPVDYWDRIYDNGDARIERIPLYLVENSE